MGPGTSVVVFGAGPVGLLCCAVSKAFGATKIVSVDINEERLAFAEKYAATTVFRSQKVSAEENAKRMIEECGLGEGADVVIDASGAEVCIQTGIHVLRRGGVYSQVGMVRYDPIFYITSSLSKLIGLPGRTRYNVPYSGHGYERTHCQRLLPLQRRRLSINHRPHILRPAESERADLESSEIRGCGRSIPGYKSRERNQNPD